MLDVTGVTKVTGVTSSDMKVFKSAGLAGFLFYLEQ